MNRVKNKVALITGGSSGLGSAIARNLIEEGARVIITGRQKVYGQTMAKKLGAEFICHDVTDEAQWKSVVMQIEEKHQALHILVNNAGVLEKKIKNPETVTLSEWRTIQMVNVEGTFLGCKTSIPLMKRSGGGSIINMSSLASFIPTPENMAYGASKAAIDHMTKSIAQYCAVAETKIRCNTVHPGVIHTAMLEDLTHARSTNSGKSYDHLMESYRQSVPQKEFQEPEDVAHAVVFLASDEATHITGIKLPIDGGITMGR